MLIARSTEVDPLGVINLIGSNLLDKYPPGSILKELLQNADDAGAKKVIVGWTPGPVDKPTHQLLQGPALFVANDGKFTANDAHAICLFGQTYKFGEKAVIGKFGLGLKSVFHLCEAFFYLSSTLCGPGDDTGLFNNLASPWVNTDYHRGWNTVAEDDLASLRSFLRPVWERLGADWFVLWLPLRRSDYCDAARFIGRYDGEGRECPPELGMAAKGGNIARTLPLLHSIEMFEFWERWMPGETQPTAGACLETVEVRSRFRACVRANADDCGVPAAGRYTTSYGQTATVLYSLAQSWTPALLELSGDNHWPKSFVLGSDQQPDKAQPHGAALLARRADRKAGGLDVATAVFLPLEASVRNDAGESEFLLSLHGCFFIDSGRRHALHAGEDVRGEWNRRLMAEGVLPLVIPAIEAFARANDDSDTLARLTRELERWISEEDRREHVCGKYGWLHRWLTDGQRWECVESSARILEIPAFGKDAGLPVRAMPSLSDASQQLVLTPAGQPRLTRRAPGRWPDEVIGSVLTIDNPESLYQDGGTALGYYHEFVQSLSEIGDAGRDALRATVHNAFARVGTGALRGTENACRDWTRALVRCLPSSSRLGLALGGNWPDDARRDICGLVSRILIVPDEFEPTDSPGTGRLTIDEAVGVLDNETTTVVRFEGRIEECPTADLFPIDSFASVLARSEWDPALDVIARALGEAIRSVNDAWGVFSRSRIALLPHQLWVCRQVNRDRPARWLVADDVGLGKTIEAGLILLPLLASGEIRRLLVLCPASLVGQWQLRMRTMFDIRLTAYTAEADTARADFWNTQNQVVASVHTLRLNRGDRHQRLVQAEPWDMVVVDEAHHLNADEESGPTLGYKLVDKLQEANRVGSMVFFTGTPHRGKNYGFLALLRLLRPDLFDPRKSVEEQLPLLRGVMIRNNKHQVTDLKGAPLFQEPVVRSETYSYTTEEDRFYRTLTEFILTGKAYAGTLAQVEGRAVMLVLIAMQKLASSSVAAIRRALSGRLDRIAGGRRRLAQLEERLREYRDLESEGDEDATNAMEEQIAELSAQLVLMADEEPRLRELVEAAEAVVDETKIRKILELVEGPFANRPVLFFTEYKATQSLLMSRLIQRFGRGSVAFINGDERADSVSTGTGSSQTLHETRERAAERFNAGEVRFLVSTEAGGEGIDLQKNCRSLIHVDLPWNPMRLHQRVGRLNRYGQTRRVEVYTVRNPDTVEARIWEKLNGKIEQITQALAKVMSQPEDLLQLVLGMSSPALFRGLFADAAEVRPESLSDWFDSRTSQFGGRDALNTVRALVGNSARFDFQQVSAQIPKLDLPDLKPFFKTMLHLNKRKVQDDTSGLSFHTPDLWLGTPGVSRQYAGMVFDRAGQDAQKVLGVGHRLVDHAISQARELTGSVASVPATALAHPLYIYRITDRVTSQGRVVRAVVVAVESKEKGRILLRDSDLIDRLNRMLTMRDPRRFQLQSPVTDSTGVEADVKAVQRWLVGRIGDLDLPFRVPEVTVICLVLPSEQVSQSLEDQGSDSEE